MSDDDGFTIKDRRRFDSDGKARPDDGDEQERERRDEVPEQVGAADGPSDAMPAIDFSTFLLSLSTSAVVHLGESPTPEGTTGKNLPMAQQVIEILAMLEEKTQGNLTDDEQKLLSELLYDLRLRYVAACR